MLVTIGSGMGAQHATTNNRYGITLSHRLNTGEAKHCVIACGYWVLQLLPFHTFRGKLGMVNIRELLLCLDQ